MTCTMKLIGLSEVYRSEPASHDRKTTFNHTSEDRLDKVRDVDSNASDIFFPQRVIDLLPAQILLRC